MSWNRRKLTQVLPAVSVFSGPKSGPRILVCCERPEFSVSRRPSGRAATIANRLTPFVQQRQYMSRDCPLLWKGRFHQSPVPPNGVLSVEDRAIRTPHFGKCSPHLVHRRQRDDMRIADVHGCAAQQLGENGFSVTTYLGTAYGRGVRRSTTRHPSSFSTIRILASFLIGPCSDLRLRGEPECNHYCIVAQNRAHLGPGGGQSMAL